MKKLLTRLETIRDEVQEKIEDREMYYDERTENWQNSDRGDDYLNKTSELEEVLDNLEMAVESLETFVG